MTVVVIAAAVFAVAQGGSGGGPLNAIAKAAEVTQGEPGGHAVIHATVATSASPGKITETGSMVFDESGRTRGTLAVQSPVAGLSEKFSAIEDGTTAYMSSDLFESLSEGKKWTEVDFSSAADGTGSPIQASGGPMEGLKTLERVQGAKEIGKEVISGVPTTRYRGTLPVSGETFGVKIHLSAPRVDVWIDAKDRVRRMQLAVSGTVGEAAESTTTDVTIDYLDFGQVPKIELPDPDEVFNATSKLESAVQSAAKGPR